MPIKENENKGFHYTVTDKQIETHKKRTILEIFEWLKTPLNLFIVYKPMMNEKESGN